MTEVDALPPYSGDWAAHDGIPLLRTLATALIEIDTLSGADAFTLPYPAEAQRALNRTVLACLLKGAAPPAGLSELLNWCRHRPIADWPLDLPDDAVGDHDCLLDPDSGRPTELCHEWAERVGDSAQRQRDREIIHAALRLCREYGEENAYSAFRGLLVNRPVLTTAELFEVTNDLALDPVHELIRRIYLPVPASYLVADGYATCGRCLTLLNPVRDGSWWCERDRCRRQGPPPIGRRLAADEVGELFQLERPLRQFVTGPGRAEADLERSLTAIGLYVQMWPGFDAYDLRITFPDGLVWAVDVKDWAHPAFLGRSARPVTQDPLYHEAFWVVPRHRFEDRPGYRKTYERHRPPVARDLPLLSDAELIIRANEQLDRAGRHTENGGHDA
ncbi:hypothetical protein [Kitasatospora sp. NPDC007106]|uniref:pPIWI_RE_Y domain-containing protein n=1 Tax=Kitasatospora sp. NPDC007106 TaxID=3156914 RepID=UPI0033DBA9D3